jgi:hypothetical protein
MNNWELLSLLMGGKTDKPLSKTDLNIHESIILKYEKTLETV